MKPEDLPLPNDPATDVRIRQLKSIATIGSEYGPLYDEATLHVISQIEDHGYFEPSPLRQLLELAQRAGLLSDESQREVSDALRLRGWTLKQGDEYARGIMQTESLLEKYGKPKQ